jgi:hypothetical protein
MDRWMEPFCWYFFNSVMLDIRAELDERLFIILE